MQRVFLLIIGFCIVACGRVAAQEISYWVGQSTNPDPIMRHHEAFMDAFIKYINNCPEDPRGEVSTETTNSIGNKSINQDFNDKTCRVETVSSIINDGCETITILIGIGPLVNYMCLTESFSKDGILNTKTILNITYQDESNSTSIESYHEYCKACLAEKGTSTSINKFIYKCNYISKHK